MKKGETAGPRILIVDDEQASIDSLRRILVRAGFADLCWTTDPREVPGLCLGRQPDLILLDLHMPFATGDRVLERLRAELPEEEYLPVIVLTGDSSSTAKRRSFSAGARDFINKPYDRREVVMRVRSQLEIRQRYREVHSRNHQLESSVRQSRGELHRSQVELLDCLARAAGFRDDETGEHARRVGTLAARIASDLGLAADVVEVIERAATLHDLGKIGISDTILYKPGKLTPGEMERMRTHVRIGAAILSGGSSRYLQIAERIALTHHEWWDGNGYLGLAGEEIPIEGRIVAVADVFDALTHERPYKHAWTVHAALEHIVQLRGRHFDPAVVDSLLRVLGDSAPELGVEAGPATTLRGTGSSPDPLAGAGESTPRPLPQRAAL